MISLFNRIQLISTYDELQREKIAVVLRRNTILYKIKVKNPSTYSLRPVASRTVVGSYVMHEKQRFKFIFYVNKNDYDRAKQLLYTEGIH